MVYSYSTPFETGKLKVSEIHTLQSVLCFRFSEDIFFDFSLCLTRRTATRFRGIKMERQVRAPCSY